MVNDATKSCSEIGRVRWPRSAAAHRQWRADQQRVHSRALDSLAQTLRSGVDAVRG